MKSETGPGAFTSKHGIAVLLIFAILFFSIVHPIYEKHAYAQKNSLRGKVIVLDPGHGGIDGGASVHELLEKNINLDIALLLKDYLVKREANVILTRESDVSLDGKSGINSSRYLKDLDARCRIINNAQPDLFVSIHANCMRSRTSARGAIVFHDEDHESAELSKAIANSISERVYKDYLKDSTVKVRTTEGDYYIFRNTDSPGVLIETGFLSNELERGYLTDTKYKEVLSLSIAEGIDDYLQYESIEDTLHEFNLKLKSLIYNL